MGTKSMGYKGRLFHGTAGSVATTQITDRVDVDYEVTPEIGSTTAAGDGTSVPINTGEATALSINASFNMIVDESSSTLTALIAAARSGTPIAMKFERASGQPGLDADVILSVKNGAPLKGEQTMDFKVEALSRSLREPKLNQ